jgi:cytidylate kinase
MAIITISRGSYSKGRDVAQEVAKRLGYSLVSREICIEASDEFNASEVKVCRAIQDAPSFFDRFTYGRERYMAYIVSAILEHFQQDNVVYHGLAGHFFVKNISHVLKVRILADRQERIRTLLEREHVSEEEAVRRLDQQDHERRQWSLNLYGVDTWDPSLYDMVVHIHKLHVADAAEIICHTVRLEQFITTPDSRKALDELALAARVKAAIVRDYPNADVTAGGQAVRVHLRASSAMEQKIVADVSDRVKRVPGVSDVSVHLIPMTLYD